MKAVMNYAEVWRRLVAPLIDALVLGALFPIILVITYFVLYQTSAYHPPDPQGTWGAGIFYWLCFGILYFIGFWAWRGQTPGKMMMGVKIVKADGSAIHIGIALLRYIGFLLSTFMVFMGHFMIIWDSKRQGLHDKIARTYVVKTH